MDDELILAATFMAMEDEEMMLMQALSKPKRKHSTWVRIWIEERQDDECNTAYKLQKRLLECDVTEFGRMLRMPPFVYEFILNGVSPLIKKQDTNYRKSISCEERLSITLKYFATGESPLSLAEQYRVGRCTMGRVIKETSQAIYSVFGHYLKTPSTPEEWQTIINDFDQRWHYPACIGAIDGKHVRLAKPWCSGSNYYNYKKFFSVVLFVAVNANYEFTYVNIGAEGKTADGGLWRDSDLYEALMNNKLNLPPDVQLKGFETGPNIPVHFIGDDAFQMTTRMQKPFAKRELTDREAIYNYRLSRARRVVENVFGICAARFRLLCGEIAMNPISAGQVVLAICTLHNILRQACGSSYMPHGSIDYEDNNYVIHPGDWRQDKKGKIPGFDKKEERARNPTVSAKGLRDTFADYFQSPTGAVSWQENHLHNRLDRLLINLEQGHIVI